MKNNNVRRAFTELTSLSRGASRYPWLRQIVWLVTIVVPLTFLFWSLTTNWQDLRSYDWQFNSIKGGIAVCCLALAFGLIPLASQQALLGLGYSIGYRTIYQGHFVAQLAKYLPGGLWIVPGRVIVFRKYGVDVISSSVEIIVELLVLLASGVVVFLPYPLFVGTGPLSQLWTLGLLLIPATMIGLHPAIFNHVLRWLLALVGYKDATVELTIRQVASMLLIDIAFWLAAGTGFYLLVTSVQAVPVPMWLALTSAFSMAWVVGFLAFLTPSGLGVREGALALLLAPLVPAPLPVVVALLARLWWTVAELISVLIAILLEKHLGQEDNDYASTKTEQQRDTSASAGPAPPFPL